MVTAPGQNTQVWPASLPGQVQALTQVLTSHSGALTVPDIEARLKGRGPWKKSLPRILKPSKPWVVPGARKPAALKFGGHEEEDEVGLTGVRCRLSITTVITETLHAHAETHSNR